MKLTVILPAVLLLGVFGAVAPETVEEKIEETMTDAEEDIQGVIDKYTKELAKIEEDDEELEAKRVEELAELMAKHERKWNEYDDDCDHDKLKLADDCSKHPDKCAKYTADLELKHEEEYNDLLDKLTEEKNEFGLDFFKKCSKLEKKTKDVKEDMAEAISKIYLKRDEKIADYIARDVAEQEKRAIKIYEEFQAKVNQVEQELEECLAFELTGVERLMTSEEIVAFDYEVLKALRYLMQKEGIDCDVHELFGTVNYGLEVVSEHQRIGRALKTRRSKTTSQASFNIMWTCSICRSCLCLPIEGNRRALADELGTSDRRVLKGILKDKLTHRLSHNRKLKEVFPDLEKVQRIKC